jgi:tripeptide aminopeptidase
LLVCADKLGHTGCHLGGGGNNGRLQTLEEWFDPTNAYYGVQRICLVALCFVGIENKLAPLLKLKP